MPKFPQHAIVKHVSGDIRGYVMNIFEQQDGSPPYYFIQWDDGTPSSHPEKELQWATTEHPVMHKTMH